MLPYQNDFFEPKSSHFTFRASFPTPRTDVFNPTLLQGGGGFIVFDKKNWHILFSIQPVPSHLNPIPNTGWGGGGWGGHCDTSCKLPQTSQERLKLRSMKLNDNLNELIFKTKFIFHLIRPPLVTKATSKVDECF